jgi:lysophospholipid acyltransferase (LPLAT)-like uncharacterized protein
MFKKVPLREESLRRFGKKVLVRMAYDLVRFYLSTVRIRVQNEDVLTGHLNRDGKAIVAFWHQRFFGVIGYARTFSSYAPSGIISMSRDGDVIAQVATLCGIRPIRGSSSRGGKEALAAIVKDLKENRLAVHAVDGPRGPRGVVKAGLMRMAQLSQAAIFPVYISIDRAWILKSWDRFLIPKPFSRILICWDSPIFVPADLHGKPFEDLRLDIETRMARGYAGGDERLGWKNPL